MEKWVLLAAFIGGALGLPTFGFFNSPPAPRAPAPPPPPQPRFNNFNNFKNLNNPPSTPSKFRSIRPARPAPAPVPAFNPPAPVARQDCVYGTWTQWSACTAQCDATAFVSRTRTVLKEASGFGAPCSPASLEEWRECQGEPCARDCVMQEWTAWSSCDAECGQGQRGRWRQIASQPINGGAACGPTEESEPCFERPCAVDCQMGQWSQWSDCSAQCEEGRRARTRSIITPAANGGRACGPAEEWEACNNGPCPRDCVMGDWAPWTPCPACGQASRSRRRSIIEQGAFGGQVCDFNGLTETESCNLSPCAIDCVMEQWSQWSQCSSDCGEGRRQRLRSIRTPAAFGGRACGPAEEWEACNNGPCAQDCQMSQWQPWSRCSAECDGGQRSRTRSILTPALFGGQPCEQAEEWEACNERPCPRDCVMGDWAPWTSCPACGQASRSRRRNIIEQGAFGGRQCDFNGLTETESCNISPCAVDCEVTPWSDWSDCNAECGTGSQQRLRSIITSASNGGRQCPKLEEWRECNNGPCRQPSICDGLQGTRFFADGCTREFILCSNGVEHPKICPEPSYFDVASSTCRLSKDVAACAAANPPQPQPRPQPRPQQPRPQLTRPQPAKSFFSRVASAFSYDDVLATTPEPATPTPTPTIA